MFAAQLQNLVVKYQLNGARGQGLSPSKGKVNTYGQVMLW